VFMDRDDTLIRDTGYLSDPAAVEPLEGACEAVRRLNEAGIPVIVVTNQSGVARGFFDEERLQEIHSRLVEVFADMGARIDAVYSCPHHPEGVVERYRLACRCRKPEPGMLIDAARDFGLDLGSCFLVGDKPHDIEAIHRVGGRGVLVGDPVGVDAPNPASMPDFVARDIRQAVEWILGKIMAEGGEGGGG